MAANTKEKTNDGESLHTEHVRAYSHSPKSQVFAEELQHRDAQPVGGLDGVVLVLP